jgi:DNA-binding LacI/PurR family transcriptional regulator
LRGCEDSLFGGYNLFVCNTNEDIAREQQSIRDLLSRSVDGLILWGTRISGEQLLELVGAHFPLVTVELSAEPIGPNHININVDNVTGARLATQHLIKNGYRRIAYLAGPPDRITGPLRLQGYQEAMENACLECQGPYVSLQRPSLGEAARATLQLLAQDPPDAIVCYNDLMAIGAMLAARRLGLRIPQDVALVGFDDIPMASLVTPLLTTVRIAQYQLGALCGQLLREELRGNGVSDHQVLFPVELIVRESSSVSAITDEERMAMLDMLIATRY